MTTDESVREQRAPGEASAKVQDAASVAQEKASELREQGSVRLRAQFDERSNQAGRQARSLAEALRRTGGELGNEGNTGGGRLVEQAADGIDRLGTYLEQKRGDEVMRDVEAFARRRPWMLAGLGMLAGLAAARFMKASSEQRYGAYQRTQTQWPTRAAVQGEREIAPGQGSGVDPGGSSVSRDVGSMTGDAPLARDPYAGTR